MTDRSSKRKAACFFVGCVVGALSGGGAIDALAQQGVPLPGSAIPQFVDPLPLLNVTPGGTIETILAGTGTETLSMCEFKANVMPSTFVPAAPAPAYSGTYVWGYRNGAPCPSSATPLPTYIGPVIVATRGTPAEIKFVNSLPDTTTSQLLAWKFSTDQTLHWADPSNSGHVMGNYSGSIPAVPHLHGGEVPPVLDGGPDAWFTSDGLKKGHSYYSKAGAAGNEVIYRYPNTQEAAPIWFHDHALGATRLNVYAGLAGGYAIVDPALTLPAGLHPVGLQQVGSTTPDYLIPLVIQDRMFDTNGQLFFPNIGINPTVHPFWIPEFVGDTIVVNGKVWPFLNVEARRYRFLLINGSNARTYELSGPTMWQIATDGGYLDAPVRMTKLVLMPGERADVIIDFAGLAGKRLVLKNSGQTPYPNGAPPNGTTVGRIIQFRVGPSLLGGVDTSYNPAAPSGLLRPAMQRLVNPATGTLAVVPAKTRLLTLNEVLGPLGPLEVLVNNTKYDGSPTPSGNCRAGFTKVQIGTGPTECFSEVPNEGDTEVWEIVNLTADAHPIHTHLTQVQLINRQGIDNNKYNKAYAAAFPATTNPLCPAGVYCPGSGPPLAYGPTLASGFKYGGNPNIQPYLQGAAIPPRANEAGWKDTIMMLPKQVTRIAVRYAPTDTLAGASGSYPFDPSAGGHGFVWHCHIIDHEDNEMMRPLMVTPNIPVSNRSYVNY